MESRAVFFDDIKNKMKRIAIQGEQGSFHDIAAHEYFGQEQIELICCATFEQVFENIRRDPAVVGMLAIENTIAGSLPEDDWDTITEVHSHPVALSQCRAFLSRHPEMKAVEAEDTAGSAEYIARHGARGWAAICADYAAEMYGMKVLQRDIHDNKHNFTRFLVVSDPRKASFLRSIERADKASLVFSLPHEEGSLSKVLTILSFYDINMTKIQSLPIIGHEWEYMFYVDVTFDNFTRYQQSIDAITPLVKNIKVLGEYKGK